MRVFRLENERPCARVRSKHKEQPHAWMCDGRHPAAEEMAHVIVTAQAILPTHRPVERPALECGQIRPTINNAACTERQEQLMQKQKQSTPLELAHRPTAIPLLEVRRDVGRWDSRRRESERKFFRLRLEVAKNDALAKREAP